MVWVRLRLAQKLLAPVLLLLLLLLLLMLTAAMSCHRHNV
jgi:hypothetical protein